MQSSITAAARAAVRGFHSSSSAQIKRKLRLQEGMLPDTRMFAPTSAIDDILEARRAIFGIVQGNGQRTGRKVLRAKLSGGTLKSYYEPRLQDFGLERVGLENPVREELYLAEQEKNRIGKTRIKPKMRGTSAEFARVMTLDEVEENLLEPLDIWAPEDALPEKPIIDALEAGLDEEEKEWLHELLGRVAASAEEASATRDAGDLAAEGALQSAMFTAFLTGSLSQSLFLLPCLNDCSRHRRKG
jgi:Mitochondrial ribosomal subunit S27